MMMADSIEVEADVVSDDNESSSFTIVHAVVASSPGRQVCVPSPHGIGDTVNVSPPATTTAAGRKVKTRVPTLRDVDDDYEDDEDEDHDDPAYRSKKTKTTSGTALPAWKSPEDYARKEFDYAGAKFGANATSKDKPPTASESAELAAAALRDAEAEGLTLELGPTMWKGKPTACKFKGVKNVEQASRQNLRHPWQARFGNDGKIAIGTYETPEQAALARARYIRNQLGGVEPGVPIAAAIKCRACGGRKTFRNSPCLQPCKE